MFCDRKINSVSNFVFLSPTHSHRVRLHQTLDLCGLVLNFNPRTHVECDENGVALSACRRYFNPRTHIECDSQCHPFSGNKQPKTNHFASNPYHSTPNKATLLHSNTYLHILVAVFGAGGLGILCALGIRTLILLSPSPHEGEVITSLGFIHEHSLRNF